MKQPVAMSLLGLATVTSLSAAAASVLILHPEDRISLNRGFLLLGLGFIFFVVLFDLMNRTMMCTSGGTWLRKKYHLSYGEVLDINNKAVSAVQAVLSCVAGFVVCTYSCARDFLRTSHFMSEAYAWFGAAYFFYDIWSMYKVHIYMSSEKRTKKFLGDGKMGAQNGDSALSGGDASVPPQVVVKQSFLDYCRTEPVILMHHLFIGGFGFMVIVYLRGGLGDCVFGPAYLMELSTPFVCLRSILSRMKLKSSPVYVLNGITMLVTFFFCRVACFPYVIYVYSQVIGVSYFEAIKTLPRGCQISILILLLPQIYWFYLMSMGAVKVFFPPNKKRSHTSGDSRKPEEKRS